MGLKICQPEVCSVSYLDSINDSGSVQVDTFNFLVQTHERQSQPFVFFSGHCVFTGLFRPRVIPTNPKNFLCCEKL